MSTKYIEIGQSHQKLQQFTYFVLAGGGFDHPNLIYYPTAFPSDKIWSLDQYLQNDTDNCEFEMIGEKCTSTFIHYKDLLGA